MNFKELIFKTITVNHVEKYANIYIHSDPNFDPEDGLLTVGKNLLQIGLQNTDPKHQVFDRDIVELFDWGSSASNDPIMVAEIYWDTQYLSWNYFVNSDDYRQFGSADIDDYDRWRTNPNTINNALIPVGYELRTFYKV